MFFSNERLIVDNSEVKWQNCCSTLVFASIVPAVVTVQPPWKQQRWNSTKTKGALILWVVSCIMLRVELQEAVFLLNNLILYWCNYFQSFPVTLKASPKSFILVHLFLHPASTTLLTGASAAHLALKRWLKAILEYCLDAKVIKDQTFNRELLANA